MPRAAKKHNLQCDKHDFTLKPKGNFVSTTQQYSVCFCVEAKDKISRKGQKMRENGCLDCPVFNQDKNIATPTFILHSQNNYFQERGGKMLEEHVQKMVNYSDEKSEMNVPKPRTKNNFCSVCRENYEDYIDHIEAPKHRRRIAASKFNGYILDLIAKNGEPERPATRIKKYSSMSSHLPTNPSLGATEDSDEVQIISNPNKRIKTNQMLAGQYQTALLAQQVFPFQQMLPHMLPQIYRYPFGGEAPLTVNCNMNFYMSPMSMYPLMPPPPPSCMTYYSNMYGYRPQMMGCILPPQKSNLIVLDDEAN